MFKDIKDITKAISSFRNDTIYLKLRKRWEDDFDLYRLKAYDAGKGYYSYTSNLPRVFAAKVISMLSGSKLMIRIPIELLTTEERRVASNIERFLYGAIGKNDSALMRTECPSIRSQMAWYSAVRGGFGTLVYVHKNETGETVPDIQIMDIYNLCYGKGKDGLDWAAYTRDASKEEIKSSYDIDIRRDSATVIDYWDTENNGVVIDNKWAKKLKKHNIGHCPVFLIKVGDTPYISQNNYSYTSAHVGESIFAAIRGIDPLVNKTISDLLTIVRRGVKPPMGYWSSDGSKTLEEDIWQVEKAASVPMETGEKIEALITPTMPQDMNTLLSFIMAEEQRGSFPYTTYGQLGFRLSGFAINLLQSGIETVILPHSQSLERGYSLICYCLQHQYGGSNFPPMKIRGRTSRNESFGYPKELEIKPSDVNPEWEPEIRLELVLPKDDAQRYLLAKAAREGEIPLLSDQTIRDEILGVEDPDLEERKVDKEWADKRLPILRLYAAFEAAVAEGREDKAMNIIAELRQLLGGSAQAGAKRQSSTGDMSRLQRIASSVTGAGIPSGETGFPPEVMPPEMAGGLPAGASGGFEEAGGL